MRLKKIACTILSLVCMFFLGIGIFLQNPVQAKAESPTVTVAINQNANNVEWGATQKRVLLDVVDIATGTTASFTAWESITSVIGNGVTMNGTGANLDFFGSTGDGVSVIYPSSLEDGAVFNIAAGTEANGHVFPEFTLQLKDGVWEIPPKEPTVELASVDTQCNNKVWSGTQMAVALIFNKNFTAKAYDGNDGSWSDPLISEVQAYTKINGQSGVIQLSFVESENANRIVFLYDSSSLIVPEGQEYTTFTIEAGAPFGGEYLPEITLQLKDGVWEVPPKEPTVALTSVDTEYNNTVWGGTQMAVGLIFDKNFTAKAYDGNDGSWSDPLISEVQAYTKINEQSGAIQLSFLVEENANRIVFLYDSSSLTVPEGQEYTTFTIEAGAPFGGEYLPEITLQLKDGVWTIPTVVQEPTVELTSVDTEYNNTVWSGTQMAVGLIFDKNFTAKAYDGNDGSWSDPLISEVQAYTKINGQSGVIQLSFLVEENGNRIVFLYDSSSLTVPEGQEYTTFTIESVAPFGGEYLPEITLYLVDGKWCANKPITESVSVTNIHNRNGGDQRLLIFISNSDYATNNTDITDKIANTNVLDYVNVYTSETEYKTLREIYQGNAQAKIMSEANAIGFAIDANYHGTAVYAVEIKASAQFPAATNDYTTYVVSEDITYYNVNYNSADTSINSFSVAWTTEKPAEPSIPELGTPDVDFTNVHSDNNNNVWSGTTRAVRLVFSENFNAKAYDGNEGGYDAATIADVRYFTKINGQSLGNLTFLQADNENSITFLYDESLLTVPEGQDYTTFTIEAGAPFGGRYLPAVTLYLVDGQWTLMYTVTLEGELATGDTSVTCYVMPGDSFAYPETYSKEKEGDANTVYVYNWYLNGSLYGFNTPITEDITLTADGTFTAYYAYNVTFNDGKTQNTIIVNEGTTVAEPAEPIKEETSEYKYIFNGWYNGETKWDFDTPITENITLTAKYDQIKKIVLSDLYTEGKASNEIKTGEITIAKSGDHYKGYIGSNVYFDLSLELSYTQVVELTTFDVKMTNEEYQDVNTSPFYLSWHVYYQRPAGTLYIEYHKYNVSTGARETFATAVSEVAISANTIYQANFAYSVIDEATGLVELYSNIAGWENTLKYELGAEYLATATGYDRIVFATEGSASEMDITFADPGLTGAAHYDVTFKNGDETILTDSSNQVLLPSMDSVFIEGGLSQVFVGWTTDVATLPNLYPAGYKLQLTGTTELHAVWIGFDMEDGASVRLVKNSSGIRFTTEVDSAGYKKLGDYILGTGTFVVPTEYLTYADFVHSSFDTGYYVDRATEIWREQGEDQSVWTYSAAFINIAKDEYTRSLSARGYLKVNFTNGTGYVYTLYNAEENARSIYEVATAAYNDTEKDYKNNEMILEYINSVVDITLSNEMGLTKTATAKGNYTLTSSSLEDKTFTVSFDREVSAAMINGTRLSTEVAKNVKVGDFVFSIKDVAIAGSALEFTVDAASELSDKYSDGNVYFRSSDSDLDFFLNDYTTRHATGIYKNGEDQKVNSVVAGDTATEFFWWEWFSTAYYIMDTNGNFDRIEGLREKLSNVPVDDYGYVWQNTDTVREANATLNSNDHRMGWPFPTAENMIVTESIRTSLWSSATTDYITKGYSTSWDFNGSDRTAWSSNVNAALDGTGLFKGTANGASKVTFSSPTLPQTSTVKKYSGISSSNITVYNEPAIYTYYAPLLELDVRMSNADNVKDIVVYFKTNEGGSTEYSMSVNEYAFIKYDYSGTYEHMLFLPMYAHENWGDSETRYVTNLRIEIIPKDGYTLSGDFALSYVRPSLDTRHTNNNSIFISSLRQDYDYTGDLAFLEKNITRARKAMNFLMQFYDEERDLINSSYLVGHDSDKTGSDLPQRTAHSLGNGYWDISFMPEYDFHSNSYFYKAVADMAYLESILAEKGSSYASDQAKAEANVQTAGRTSNVTLGKGFAESDYSALDLTTTATNTLNAIRATTNNTNNTGFWDATKGRFIAGYGDANADGTSEWVDYGYLVWNLEAIYYGIATEEQAELIMQWVTGERTVAGDTSTGEDIYFFELAPRATTYQGSSKTDSSVYTGVWHGTNNGGEYGVSQVQHGGAIMYTSYYDLMNRIAVNGADDAYTRLKAIKDWYMDVYAYYQSSGSDPDDFYWNYYENSQWDSDGDGVGEYWKLQNGVKGNAERDGFTGGVIGIDGEFLESFLPVAAIPYGFFGIESLGNGTLQIAPKLPGDLDYWTAENLTFGGCKYDLTIYENALQITAVDVDEATDLTLKMAFDVPASGYKVYVNGFATTEYEVVNGQIIVELAFGNAIVEIR